MKSLHLILVLCVLALALIACSDDQEKIDRAVQMTIEAQQAQSVRPTETVPPTQTATPTPPLPTRIATEEAENTPTRASQQSTATPTTAPTVQKETSKSDTELATKILGTWLYVLDEDREYYDFMHFGKNGELWWGQEEPFRFEYEIVDGRSLLIKSGVDTTMLVTADLPNDNTLILELDSGRVEMNRQAQIENIEEKLLGYWQDDFSTVAYLPNKQLVTEWDSRPYEVVGNVVVFASVFPVLIISVDEDELVNTEEGGPAYSSWRIDEAPANLSEQLVISEFVGTWVSEMDGFYLWLVIGGEGQAILYDDEYEYALKEDSLELFKPDYPDNPPLYANLVDDDTLRLYISEDDVEFLMQRQPRIERLQDKLLGIWLGEEEDDVLMFLPDKLLFPGGDIPYTLLGNTILLGEYDDAGLVLSVDDLEMALVLGGERTIFQDPVQLVASSAAGNENSLFPFGTADAFGEGECGYIDKQGNVVIPPILTTCDRFRDGVAVVYVTPRLGGYIDIAGEFIVEPKFINPQPFSEGLARVRNEESLVGYIDRAGEFAILPQFFNGDNFQDGLARVEIESDGDIRPALIDKTGNVVRWLADDEFYRYSEGFAAVRDPNGCYYINTEREVVVQTQYDYCRGFSEGLAAVEDELGCYYINTDGEVVIQTQYGYCGEFSDGLANVSGFGGYRCGYIDRRGRTVIDLAYSQCRGFSEGVAPVETVEEYSAFIDTRGRYIFGPAEIDWVDEFFEGLGPFSVGEHIGYVDKRGEIVYRPAPWSDALLVDREQLSALSPQEYSYMTRYGTEFAITQYIRQIIGSRIVWTGTVLGVDANGIVTARVDASDYGQTHTVDIRLSDIDQATLLRLRANNQITFSAILADFEVGERQESPTVKTSDAMILSIGD